MLPALAIRPDDLSGDEIAALLKLHWDEMHAWSPEDSCHVFALDTLRGKLADSGVAFWSAWASTPEGDVLAGCGALQEIEPGHGELKSMRAAPAWRGRGVGKAMLDHLVAEARRRGFTRLSLETGSTEPFAPARGLYAANGFEPCGPFGSYRFDPWSVFMTRPL